jgi:mono/diheme cytochrome c family protein
MAQAVKPADNRATREKGRQIFDRSCLFCHGVEGKGDGPAGWFLGRYAAPRPRNFTSEGFKLRSTESGMLPTDQDLFRTITQGIPGYMPSFASLTEEERWQVIAYVKAFNPAFKDERREPMAFGVPPFAPSEESIANGQRIYEQFGCMNCHGLNGKGDGPESLEGNLKDARGLIIRATDLTERSSFKNGSSARDIYRSIFTGFDGAPMPSFVNQFQGNGKSDRDAWDLVHYILSLSPEGRLP